MRIGFSKDLHLLKEDRPLMIGGVHIPFYKGTLGYSDGDALLHAIAESLLGSLALGDLGTHFPPNDERFLNIDSKIILKESYELVKKQGYKIVNIDTMDYLEKPKLKDYILEIRKSISEVLEIDINQISVKATTYEGTGEIGSSNAISCEAVCLVERI